MAKISVVARNKKRAKLIKRYDQKRRELKAKVIDPSASPEEVMEAFVKLQKLPRNASPVRYRNRCEVTGRGRGVLRRFGLGRNEFRSLAHQGMIVGVTKSSW